MFGFFLADELPTNYAAVMATDRERFNRFFHAMLDRGVYLAPAMYEACFVSAAHTPRRHRPHDARRRARRSPPEWRAGRRLGRGGLPRERGRARAAAALRPPA